MHITICAVGKEKDSAYLMLFKEFAKRINGTVQCVEVETKKTISTDTNIVKKQESILLWKAQPQGGTNVTILLDPEGAPLSSEKFADKLIALQLRRGKNFSFFIGGAFGHDNYIKEKADFMLSFGNMIWPHRLMRIMLMEQIYRAQSIIQGHPYHK